MRSKAPTQIQVVVSLTTLQQLQISTKKTCDNIVNFFSEASEKCFGFKQRRSLHLLYDKVLAVSCTEMIPGSSLVCSELCMAARAYGYQSKVVAPTSLFADLLRLDDFNVSAVSEAWIVHVASDQNDELEQTWRSLSTGGTSVVLVTWPEFVLDFTFLDIPDLSATSFRIVSPNAYSNLWPLEFCIDEFGTFSRSVTCPHSGTSVTTLGKLLESSIFSRDAVPAS